MTTGYALAILSIHAPPPYFRFVSGLASRRVDEGGAEDPEALRYWGNPLVASGGKLPPVIHASGRLPLEQLVNKHDL